jgi:hypothetical protein
VKNDIEYRENPVMKIIITDKRNVFERNLKNYIGGLINPILLDITWQNTSERVLTLSDEGIYTLSYSRPFWINVLSLPLASYEFVFSVVYDQATEKTFVKGRARLKRYVMALIVLLCLIFVVKAYETVFQGAPFEWFFFCVLPLMMCVYFVVEYYFFIRKVKKFLNGLVV